jgi:predicted DCC family thiol-disulfide oxidoreductase YuxK
MNRGSRRRILNVVTDLNNLGGRLLVIFDGSCLFCNQTVRWFLHRDCADRLRFVSSDSPKILALIRRHPFPAPEAPGPLSTLVVVRDPMGPNEEIFLRSDAAHILMAELRQPWPRIATLLRLIPRPIRDLGYRIVAQHRYHIEGRLAVCPLPTPEERGHFL